MVAGVFELTPDDTTALATEVGRVRVGMQLLVRVKIPSEGDTVKVDSSGRRDLFVYVIEGSLTADIDGESETLGPGDAMDARSPYKTTFTAETDLRFVWATTPVVQAAS